MHWILLVLASALAAWSVYEIWRGWTSTFWSVVDGEIVRSTVRERTRRRGRTYVPAVEYRYVVDGEAFTGRRLHFGGLRHDHDSLASAYAEIHGIDPGVRLAVYYDPRAARRSVLRPGYYPGDFAGIAVAAVLAIMGAYP